MLSVIRALRYSCSGARFLTAGLAGVKVAKFKLSSLGFRAGGLGFKEAEV